MGTAKVQKKAVDVQQNQSKPTESKKKHFKGMGAVDKAVAVYVLISQSYNCLRKNFMKGGYKDTHAYRAYACELPHSEQIRLLKTIQNAKCKIMLCGYKTLKGKDIYDIYLLPYGWKCYKLAEVVKACQGKKKDMAEEFIWVNYELPDCAKYVISMKEYNSL